MLKKTKTKFLFLILIIFTLSMFYILFINKNFNIFHSNKIILSPTPSLTPSASPSASPAVSKSSPSKSEKKEKLLNDIYQQGYNSFFQKDYISAIKFEDSIIQQDPSFYKAYNLKGIALCYSGDFQSGMENIDKSLALNADYDYARFNKALAYELFGYYDKALTWYDKCLENTTKDMTAWSYYGKASIYGRRGDVKNTVNFLKLAIEYNSGIKEYSKTEEDFHNVKDSKEFQDLIFK